VLSPYRRVLSLPGALAFSLTGLVAQLPISMVSLGIVMLISLTGGSYGYAGTVSAANVLAAAACGPWQGRLADRFGQHRVLPVSVTAFGVAIAGLIAAVELGAPTPVPHILSALAGAVLPPIGSCVRARWAHLLTGTPDLQTAYALEAVVDEAVFMSGPIIVTLLATAVDPLAGLGSAALFGVLGTYAFAAQRRTEPPVLTSKGHRNVTPPIGWQILLPVCVAAICLGTLFGSNEVVTFAFARSHGHAGATGVLLAVWALGSLLAGLITGMVKWKATPVQRFRWGMIGMAMVMLPLVVADNLVVLGLLLFLAGFAISPTLVASVSYVESMVPAARLTESISWVTTGLAVGIAPGAAIAGHVIDSFGAAAGFWVPALAGVTGAVVAFGTCLTAPPNGRTGLALSARKPPAS
jgi:MFS family permease